MASLLHGKPAKLDSTKPDKLKLESMSNNKINMVDIAGHKCTDGSQYSFFVSPRTKNGKVNKDEIIVELGAGGACFDHATCSSTYPPEREGWYVSSGLFTQLKPLLHKQDAGKVNQKAPFGFVPTEGPLKDYTYVHVMFEKFDEQP